MKKILIIGSTGMLGKPVTKELMEAGYDTSLLTRNPGLTQKIYPGKPFIEGNVFDKNSLVSAMEGKDFLYINLSVPQHSAEKDPQAEREGVDNILEAARQTGIKRIYYLSSLIKNYEGMNGFSWWAFRIKQSAVDKIKSSGIPSTIFYPSTFMETFPFQMMRGHHIMLLGRSEAPMWFIAARDYSRQVVAALQQDDLSSKEYSIQGPEPFTFEEAARVVIKNYRKDELKVIKAPIGLVKFMGKFVSRMDYGAKICEALNKYPEQFESEKSWNELGKPDITLASYASSL